MPRALKVYRTAIGFHDAYIAAPTQKAALEAWGADSNLFASGRAELVEDPTLIRAPLAEPGKVIKVLRGSAAEQFAALEKSKTRPAREKPAPTSAKAVPRPSRVALDRADKAIVAAEGRHDRALDALTVREAKLREERRALQRQRDAELDALREKRDRAAEAYEGAMRAWRG
jgi:hypothetical protein